MSLSSSAARTDFNVYDGTNYSAWIEGVQDYLLEEDMKTVFECSERAEGEDGAAVEITGT